MLICLSLWMGSAASLWSHHQGKVLLKNDLHASIFKPCVCLFAHKMFGKLCSFKKRNASTESAFSPLSIRNCLHSKSWDLQSFLGILTPRVRAVCFHELFKPCKHFPSIYWDCSWRNRLHECIRVCWAAYCAYLHEVPIQWKLASGWSGEQPACFRNSKGWTNLSLSKVRKQQLDGFSRICYAAPF